MSETAGVRFQGLAPAKAFPPLLKESVQFESILIEVAALDANVIAFAQSVEPIAHPGGAL